MLEAKYVAGHWRDDPETQQHSIVVVTDDQRHYEMGDPDSKDAQDFEARLENELHITDEDVIFYQDEWDPEDVCSGDYVIDEVEETVVSELQDIDKYQEK